MAQQFHFWLYTQKNGEGHGNPLQYPCLENPMDRGACWATVHGVPKSRTHSKEMKTRVLTKTCTWMFITAWFLIAKICWRKPEYVISKYVSLTKKIYIFELKAIKNSKQRKSSLSTLLLFCLKAGYKFSFTRDTPQSRLLSAQRWHQKNLQTNLTALVSSHLFISP